MLHCEDVRGDMRSLGLSRASSSRELALSSFSYTAAPGYNVSNASARYVEDYEEAQGGDFRAKCLLRRLAEKSAQAAELSLQTARLQANSGDTSFDTERLQIMLSGLQETIVRLRASRESRETELAHADKTIAELRHEYSAVNKKLNTLVASKGDDAVSSRSRANTYNADQIAEIDAKEKVIKETIAEITSTSDDLGAADTALARLQGEYDARCEELAEIRAQAAKLQKDLTDREEDSADKETVRAEVQRLQEEVWKKNSKLVALSEELAQERAGRELLQRRVDGQERDSLFTKEQQEFHQAPLLERLSKVKEAIACKEAELTAAIASMRGERLNVEKKETTIQQSAQELIQDVVRHTGSVVESGVDEEVSRRLQTYFLNLSLMLSQATTELADKQAELAGKNTEVKRLHGTIESRMMAIDATAVHIDGLYAELARKKELLLTQCDEAEFHNSELVDEVRALRAEKAMAFREELEAEYDGQLNQLELDIRRLMQKLMEKTDQVSKQDAECGWELEQLRREVRATDLERSTLQDMVQCLHEEETTKDASIRAMEESIRSLEKETAARVMQAA